MALYQIFIVVSFEIFQIESVTIGKLVKNDKLVVGLSLCLSYIIVLCIIADPHYIIVRSHFKDCHLLRGQDVRLDRLVCWLLIVSSHVRLDISSFYHNNISPLHSLGHCQLLLSVAQCQGDAGLALRRGHLGLGDGPPPRWEVMQRLGVDWRQRQPGAELDLNTLRVWIVGGRRGHLALVDVYWGRQRPRPGGDNIPGSGGTLQVERLQGRSGWALAGQVWLPRLHLDQERSGLVMMERLVWWGNIELQHVPRVAGDVVVSQSWPNVTNLGGQSWA